MKESTAEAPKGPVSRRLFFLLLCVFGYVLLLSGWWLVSRTGWNGPREPVSILVLPFPNSPQLAPELASNLSKNQAIRILTDTTVPADDRQVRDLGVQWKANAVLSGIVSTDGAQRRLTVRLIDSASGYHVWEHTYESDSTGAKRQAAQIADSVVRTLRGER